MGLQAAFDLELGHPPEEQLSRLFNMCIQQLQAAPKSHKHPWHLGVIATVNDARPHLRTVVLRHSTPEPLTLRCHTDMRSPKVAHLESNARLEWLFYQPSTRIQLRCSGWGKIIRDGETWERAWKATNLSSRRCYLAPHAPGEAADAASINLPAELSSRDPTQEESEQGAVNFGLVECGIDRLDWLYLKHTGHVRFQANLSDGTWNPIWATP